MKIIQYYVMAFCFGAISVSALATPTVTVTGTPPSAPTNDWTTIQSYNNPGSQSQQYNSNMNAIYTQKAMEEAKAAEEKKKRCAEKDKKIAEASNVKNNCEYDAIVKRNTSVGGCSPIEKAIIQIDVSKGVNVGVDAALKKFSIDIGAVTGFVVSGTLEYSPRQNCIIMQNYSIEVDNKMCANNFQKVKNSFSDCQK